ncbi:MAG: FAD-binding oxidoreductase [Anaerolineae bacterium]
MQPTDVVIIGGGISGVAAAYELAGAGASVTLVEKGDLASMASGWTLAGVRQSGRDAAEMPLAVAAVRRWERLADELDADIEYRQDGNLRLARTEDEVAAIARVVADGRAARLPVEYLDGDAARRLAPALAPSILAASYCPTDGHANPLKVVGAFAAAAARRGATIMTRTEALGIEVAGGRVAGVRTPCGLYPADVVVVAAGVYADRLLAPLGIRLPITVRHVSAIGTTPLPPLLRQVLGVGAGDFAARQQVDGRFRMTGSGGDWQWPTSGLTADAVQPPIADVAAVLGRATAVLPALADARIARVWGGLIDMTPDALPILERAPEIDGLVIAAGFSGHGFCLGPITGRIIYELATTGESSLPLAPFRRARFDDPIGQTPMTLHG